MRWGSNGVTAFISIMRGCDNMCAFCVVPFTRGRERSREPGTIVQEASDLVNASYREVTLLGQNVDSYEYASSPTPSPGGRALVPTAVPAEGQKVDFADLLAMVAEVDPLLRVRFSTSHPKDMTDKVLEVMARYPNIAKPSTCPCKAAAAPC